VVGVRTRPVPLLKAASYVSSQERGLPRQAIALDCDLEPLALAFTSPQRAGTPGWLANAALERKTFAGCDFVTEVRSQIASDRRSARNTVKTL
jgi:hypothetical protein